jgi:nicotinamide-nucleotide amidase
MNTTLDLLPIARSLIERYAAAGLMIATAESCTGGLIAGTLTEVSGSSAVVDRGFVTYSNDAKTDLLDVDADLIAREGAVSEPVARAMAEGALRFSRADCAVAVTGIAGPGGGSAVKPVGLVHFGAVRRGRPVRHLERRFGAIGRHEVRHKTVEEALRLLNDLLLDA